MTGRERKAIYRMLDEKRLSYGVIAEMMGVTRNVIAGLAFRRRHPYSMLISSPGRPGKPNKIGHGWQPHSYEPQATTLNTR